jgi:hypothetical protein
MIQVEENYKKLDFILGTSEKDEGLLLLVLSFLGFLIAPLGLISSPIVMARNKKTNTLYTFVSVACVCCIVFNLFIGYGILSDILGWGTTTVNYLI